jgi:type II secretory pathway component PulF
MIAGTTYEYIGIDRAGNRRKGVARAATEVDAFRQVSAAGLTPVRIKAIRVNRGRRSKVRKRDVANFTYQLGVLIGARVPIGEGIRGIAEQEPTGKFREVLMMIASRIESGSKIADALREHEEVFGKLYVETIKAAEESGNMIKVLEYLSEMLDRDMEMHSTVRSALMYPFCTLVVLGVAVAFLLGFVVPRFSKMYADKAAQLPVVTQIMIAVGNSVQHYWWAYLAVIAGIVFGVRKLWELPRGRDLIENILHRVPVISQLFIGMSVARFARVFGLCLNSGLSLIDALTMGANASGRPALVKDVHAMVDQVRNGGRLSHVLLICNYLPSFAKRMLTSGEESAELTRMCGVIAKHYERDTAATAKNMSTLIEPVLIVLIAGVVLAVALGIFLPMWDMMKLMR